MVKMCQDTQHVQSKYTSRPSSNINAQLKPSADLKSLWCKL